MAEYFDLKDGSELVRVTDANDNVKEEFLNETGNRTQTKDSEKILSPELAF